MILAHLPRQHFKRLVDDLQNHLGSVAYSVAVHLLVAPVVHPQSAGNAVPASGASLQPNMVGSSAASSTPDVVWVVLLSL